MSDFLVKFSSLVKYSIRKILLKKKVVSAFLGFIFIVAVMGYASTQSVEKLSEGTQLMNVLILSFLVPVISMIYGSTIIRDEMDDRSMTHVVTSPMKKTVSYFGYYLALVVSLNLMLAIITTGGFLSFFAPLGIGGSAMDIYLSVLSLSFIATLIYSALFLMVSLLTSKSIYFGLFYAFIWEGFVGSLPGNIQKIAISHYIKSIGSRWMEYAPMENATSIRVSVFLVVILIVILLFMGGWFFDRKEFP